MRASWRDAVRVVGVVLASAPVSAAGGGRTERVAHRPAEMVVVRAGSFTMGVADDDDARAEIMATCQASYGDLGPIVCQDEQLPYRDALPAREVYLPAFAIDRHETTVADYRRCVAAGACDIAPLVTGDQRYTEAALPVGNLTWHDAAAYCGFVGKRLPTEAEWEKAARGVDARPWPWGRIARDDDFNHGAAEAAALVLTQVMQFGAVTSRYLPRGAVAFVADASDGAAYAQPPGAAPWDESPGGVYGLAGNLSEWVEDYYAEQGYADLPVVSPVRLSRDAGYGLRVARGGSWLQPPFAGRTYHRRPEPANRRAPDLGVRCARSVRG